MGVSTTSDHEKSGPVIVDPPTAPVEKNSRSRIGTGKAAFDELELANAELEERVARRTEALRGEISDRKQVEAQRKWLMEHLERRNAELQEFTYTVSHDLKSPLVTILGFLGLLEKDVDSAKGLDSADSERIRRDIEPIRTAAEQMTRMLNELLELSRIGETNSERSLVSVGEAAHEAMQRLAGQISEKNARVVIAADFPTVSAVWSQLVHMMQNLIGNAVKYMGDQPQPLVEVDFRRGGKEVVYTVCDNGVGIEPRFHDKVFGLFERMDEKREGTGLGLTIVKRVVEVHGGRIWIESEAGQGATFCFTLGESAPVEILAP